MTQTSVSPSEPDMQVPLPCKLRIAIARSILDQRPPTPLTCDLAARALQGFDVVAEAGVI